MVVSEGAHCAGVGCHPCALEGGAGDGTHCPLWLKHGGGHSGG